MIDLQVKGIDELRKALGDQASRLPKEIATAINATAKATKRQMAKEVTQELATPQKVVTQTLSEPRKAKAGNLGATVRLSKTKRISLRDFGARQNKNGVSYKVSKSRGRQSVPGAFQGPRPGAINTKWRGHTFKRVGKARLPIVKLHGPSPWGVYVKRGSTARTVEFANKELEKQVQRRVRAVLVRRGLIAV